VDDLALHPISRARFGAGRLGVMTVWIRVRRKLRLTDSPEIAPAGPDDR
jgi:hypothetical protein